MTDAPDRVQGFQVAYRRAGSDASPGSPADAGPSLRDLDLMLPGGGAYDVFVRSIAGAKRSDWSQPLRVGVADGSLPMLSIDTTNGAPVVNREDYVPGNLSLAAASGDATAPVQGALEIRGRGNSTWFQAKKPYKLKLAKSTALLGMPKNKHWVLLANAFDPTRIRNTVAFSVAGLTRLAWTPRSQPVELVLNGRYLGLYDLAEQVRVDSSRVAIDAMTTADISGKALTGGYLLERDTRWDPATTSGFRTPRGEPFAVNDPEVPGPEQLAYIRGYFSDAEAALFGSGFADPATGYAKYLDVDTFVEWYVATEFNTNWDAWVLSTYLVKPRGKRLAMGPVWDNDLTFGSGWDGVHPSPREPMVTQRSTWFARLAQDPVFMGKVRARWAAVRPTDSAIEDMVARAVEPRTPALAIDHLLLNESSEQSAEQAQLVSFMKQRAAWLDEVWAP